MYKVPLAIPFLLAIAILVACDSPTTEPAPPAGARGVAVVEGAASLDEAPFQYGASHALLIGVSEYTGGWRPLVGVKEDIPEVAAALQPHGFSITTVLDPDGRDLERALDDFLEAHGYEEDNRLLIYFAGHGATLELRGGEMGYIVPADAPLIDKDRRGFMKTALDMEFFERYAKQLQAQHVLFVFDSCFAGTVFHTTRADKPSYIDAKMAEPVRQFITSGRANEEVPDRSEFRRQFVKALAGEGDTYQDGYVTGTELGQFLFNKVVNYSQETQHPQDGKIKNPELDRGDFVFVLRGDQAPKRWPREQGESTQRLAATRAAEEPAMPSFALEPPKGCGVGSAKMGRTLSISRTAAMSRARADLARQIQTEVHALVKDYALQGQAGGEEFSEERVESVSKQISKVSLVGTRAEKLEESNGELFALVCMDPEAIADALSKAEGLSTEEREALRERAQASFRELDTEVEALE